MTHKDALIIIDSIRRSGYKPNDWESSFMQSVSTVRYEVLTYKQHKALEAIYTKSAGGGIYQKRSYV